MVPKIIHHIWLENNPLPKNFQDNIDKWKELHPDYEHMMWTTSDFGENEFTRYCSENGHWQYYGDWLRVNVLNKYGGIYLDTDVVPLGRIPDRVLDHEFSIVKVNCHWLTSWFLASSKNNPLLDRMIDHYNQPLPDGFTQKDLEDQFTDGNIFRKHLLEHYGKENILTQGVTYNWEQLKSEINEFFKNSKYSDLVMMRESLTAAQGFSGFNSILIVYPYYGKGNEKVNFLHPNEAIQWSNRAESKLFIDQAFCIHTKDENFMNNLGNLKI